MADSYPTLTKDEILALRRRVSREHRTLAKEFPWLDAVDAQQRGAAPIIDKTRVVVFNAERGRHFDAICALLREHPQLQGADVVLLSEVDWGMARSGNRHVARDLAEAFDMSYVFGVEFLELSKGDALEMEIEGDNTKSLHGNAILSRWPLQRARTVRLPAKCDWREPQEARVGGRMALVAEIDTEAGPLALASTHLENRTTPNGRREQMKAVLEAVREAPRAVVAGDLNTSTIDPDDTTQLFSIPDLLREDRKRLIRPQEYEPLFDDVRAADLQIDELNVADAPTSLPVGIEDRAFHLKLDWVFARGGRVAGPPAVVPAQHGGKRVSDHEFLVVDLEWT
jgi:endonuclease/exonuclease/phosphatase family metal-dependent hydrolase